LLEFLKRAGARARRQDRVKESAHVGKIYVAKIYVGKIYEFLIK